MPANSLSGKVALLCAALFVITFAQRTASADEVFIAGSTLACFGAGCTPATSSTFMGLTFSSSTFAITTTSGFRQLDGAASPGSNFNNLGSLTLSTTPGGVVGQPFTMQITFTAPQGIIGSNQITIAGTISKINDGVIFEWDPFSTSFSFIDLNCEPDPTGGVPGQQTTCGTGSFRFFIHDVVIDPGQTKAMTGSFAPAQQQPIPEPTTILLLGTGVAGLAGIARRRIQKN